jgi:hypothetical protein
MYQYNILSEIEIFHPKYKTLAEYALTGFNLKLSQ